jgi:hypothetical protein
VFVVPAFHTVSATLTGDKAVYKVENMIHTSNQRLVVEFKLGK